MAIVGMAQPSGPPAKSRRPVPALSAYLPNPGVSCVLAGLCGTDSAGQIAGSICSLEGDMDPAYISALAALAGATIGGLTSFSTSWLDAADAASARASRNRKG
jgi:hypothetical protein